MHFLMKRSDDIDKSAITDAAAVMMREGTPSDVVNFLMSGAL